jgi:glycosyltransferase involved in cell wall biosynthesis
VRFGYLGGAHPWKGFGTLASAVSLVERDFILELHGVDKGEWERAAQPDTRVLCLPRFTPADLPRIMRRLDVVLLPSIVYESFSLVTREALQYGRPVIASRCGGPESILRDGSNGLLFDRGDAAGLARAMQTFVDDGELLANAKQKATQTPVMTVSEQASEIERVYGSASRSRPSAPPAERLPRSIFFVAGMDGAPFRYRVANLVETARSLGLKASARFYRDEEVLALAGEHDVVVLNRVPWDPYIARVVERARAAGAVVVFAVDDLIFDPKADIPALSTLPRDIVERYWEGVRLFRATLDRSDAFLGSTEALADAASGTGRKAFVVPNTMSRELIELSNIVYQHRSKRAASGRVRIGYFSGTDSHDRDLASITSALRLTLERNPTVQLVFGGHLGLPAELKGHEDRIAWLPFVPWRKLPGLLSTIDINLAPLETGYAFNDAKSELKWFEAAAVGIPTIASATRPFKTAIRHGVDGYVAETPAQWSELIQALVDDPALRARIGEAAHSAAIERNGPDAGIAALAKALGQIENLRTTPPRLLPRPSPEELNAIRRSGIVIGKAAMEPNDLVAGPSQPFGTQPTPPLGDGVTALQPLFLPDGLLQRVDVMVATYARVYHHDLVLQLIDLGTGSKLAEQRLPAEHACDNAWLAFELGGIPTDEGTQYALAISAPGAREGISLYCRPAGWPAGAGTCGALRGVDLAYRTWMRSHTDGDDAQAPDRSEGALALDDIERRLHVAEERLADALKPRLTTSERIRKTTAWRSARKIVAVLRASNAVGPSLPYTALRKIIRATRPAAYDADVELLMQRMQASRAYRTARRFYRSITRRP